MVEGLGFGVWHLGSRVALGRGTDWTPTKQAGGGEYRGTSLIRNYTPIGP
jgi:hypothetical protein